MVKEMSTKYWFPASGRLMVMLMGPGLSGEGNEH